MRASFFQRARHLLELRKRLAVAKKNAPDDAKLEAIKDEEDRVTNNFLRGRLTNTEYAHVMEQLAERSGTVVFKDLAEMKEAVGILGFKDNEIEGMTRHEQEHCEKAVALGFNVKFRIEISKAKNGGFHLYPAIAVDIPEDSLEEDFRQYLKGIIKGADDLSPRDESQLKDT